MKRERERDTHRERAMRWSRERNIERDETERRESEK